MITVYYPYWESASEWEELRYSLRSLDRHLKTEFEVFIVGDLPRWAQNVTHIPYAREYNATNPSTYNALRMLQLFLNYCTTRQIPDDFIRMYDDIYLLQDRCPEDLMVTRIIRTEHELNRLISGGQVWRKQVEDTIARLRQLGYKGYMTESHCPELFSVYRMQNIFVYFGLPTIEYLTSTLYYNVYPYPKTINDKKVERSVFYGEENDFSFTSENVSEKCKGKYYLNHNDTGLNSELRNFIRRKFRVKSRFEK
jgi:hypothetical protein